MEHIISGRITAIQEKVTGTSKAGKSWTKINFVLDSGEDYNNIYAFQIFGEEKVDNFLNYNKVDQQVTVKFNINCREYQGRYYTDLQAWRIESEKKEEVAESVEVVNPDIESLPF